MEETFIESAWTKPDKSFEIPLRPQLAADFVGQTNILEQLNIFIGAAKQRKTPLGHMLFFGPPGLGKTTLAHIVAKAMGTNLTVTSGPVIEKAGDLAGLLTNLKEGDVLFIDEIHRLSKTVEEYLYPAIENFSLDLLIDSGPAARSVQIKLNHFTLIGATTSFGALSAPLRSRFIFSGRLNYYSDAELSKILVRSAKILSLPLDNSGSLAIAQRSRGTPRIANNLLRWVRDYALARTQGIATAPTAIAALEMLEIDQHGLDEMDKRLLQALTGKLKGGPAGLHSLAASVGEEPGTLEEVHEPYLILEGYLQRTQQGRVALPRAYEVLGLKPPASQATLL